MSAAEPRESSSGEPDVVITGHPSALETAAVLAALTAMSRAGGTTRRTPAQRRTLWNSRSRAARPPLSPGPGAWRASRLPR